ncbi:MAG: tetratricopeptide repeat protein [Crocinitomicaceae bacterium]|nr:tetratricopeptide repeat protein [Crocinitomicaceae bacterium]
MKNLVVTLILLTVSSSSFSQEWVDAVKRARKSYQASDYKKALTYYQRAQKLAPDDVNLSDEIGQTSYKLGDFEKSEQFFQENTAAKSSKLEKAKSFHNIGNSRMKNKNYQGAVEAYKASLRLHPESDKTRYNLSEALRQIKKEAQQKQNQSKSSENQNDANNSNGSNKDQTNRGGERNKENQKSENRWPNKTTDRILKELMKKDAETKQKIDKNLSRGVAPKSGKDW